MGVDKYYPVQGVNKFQTVSFPMTKAFAVDFGAQSTGTYQTASFPKGAVILGFSARVTEAMETAGAGTLQLGFTGTQMLSSATGSAVAVLDAVLRPSTTAVKVPLVLTADDTFDIIVGTTSCTAGKVDVFVTYIPLPVDDLSTSDFLSYVTS